MRQENERNSDMKIVFWSDGIVWRGLWVTYPFQKAQVNFQINIHDSEGEGRRFGAQVLEDSNSELAGVLSYCLKNSLSLQTKLGRCTRFSFSVAGQVCKH